MEELLPKDRNSRAVQVFGADGRAQSTRNRENYLPSAMQRQEPPGSQFKLSFHFSSLFLQRLHLPDWSGTTLWVALGH